MGLISSIYRSTAIALTAFCTRCDKDLPATNFSPNKMQSILRGKKRVRGLCLRCQKAKNSHADPRKSLARVERRWARRIAVAEKQAADHPDDKKLQLKLVNARSGAELSLRNNQKTQRLKQKVRRLRELAHKYQIARREAVEQACPNWVDIDQIQQIYEKCRLVTASSGILHHVDHVVPLRGKTVCGLHVPYNLSVITAEENMLKGNKFSDCAPEGHRADQCSDTPKETRVRADHQQVTPAALPAAYSDSNTIAVGPPPAR